MYRIFFARPSNFRVAQLVVNRDVVGAVADVAGSFDTENVNRRRTGVPKNRKVEIRKGGGGML
jgi:hypothetical protein